MRRKHVLNVFHHFVVLGSALVFLVPLAWTFITSIKYRKDIFTEPPTLVFDATIQNYVHVLLQSDFGSHILNSVIISFTAGLATCFIGALAAYGFVRYRIPGSKNILFWILSLRMIPPLAVIVPFYLMSFKTGLYDTRLGMIVIYTAMNLPLVVWLLMGYFKEVPLAVEEAALVDGCNRWSILWRIVLPLSLPGLTAAYILCIIFNWNEFPFALVLTSRAAKTAAVSILAWDTSRGLEWGNLTASGMVVIGPILVFTMFVQKYLVRGLTLGALKD